MRYPPAVTTPLGTSRVYQSFVLIVTIILIALFVYSMPASGYFSLKNSAVSLLSLIAVVGLLCDAWRKPKGVLHYAHGQWEWQLGDRQLAGTLRLHLDLQCYMLVSFVPIAQSHPFFPTTQWFHIEAWPSQADNHASVWLALRRAVYAPAAMAATFATEQGKSHEGAA